MASFNKVILMGNLTRDIEVRHTANNNAVGNFGLAVNEKYGEKETTCFVDCTAWGKTAETMSQHLHKGDPVLVEGRLTLEQWDDKNGGGKRSKHTVTVDRFTFVGGKKASDGRTPAEKATDGWDDNDIGI
jgi:single-strand DNA-binding protein